MSDQRYSRVLRVPRKFSAATDKEQRARPVRALVLAGTRTEGDPLVAASGKPAKALVPVAGRPMLAWVVESLLNARIQPPVTVVVQGDMDQNVILDALPDDLRAQVSLVPAAGGPSASVLSSLERRAAEAPALLVTTADNPLLRTETVNAFLEVAEPAEGFDAFIALVPAALVRAAFPARPSTFYRFRDCAVSGANMFLFRTIRASAVAAFWRRLEAHRKSPLKMARQLGIATLLAYRFGWLTLDGALERLGERTGCALGAVLLNDAEAAVDVDTIDDLSLVEPLLRARAARLSIPT